jgi:hypothetical protein
LNNALGRTGRCVRREEIPGGYGLIEAGAVGCPVPCNPTWTQGEIDEVCGEAASCCQTVELDEADCVLDEDLGCYRPARGDDIFDLGDPWDKDAHETHQDPELRACTELAEGDQEALEDCLRQLSVADQRGYCMFLNTGMGETCGVDREDYVSPCDRLNLDAALADCVE